MQECIFYVKLRNGPFVNKCYSNYYVDGSWFHYWIKCFNENCSINLVIAFGKNTCF